MAWMREYLQLLEDDKQLHKAIMSVELISSIVKKHCRMKGISIASCNTSENIKL